MKLSRTHWLLATALTAGCAEAGPPGDVADVVYTNGRIYTVNEAQPWAEAMAVKDGKFLVVGSDGDVEAVTGQATHIEAGEEFHRWAELLLARHPYLRSFVHADTSALFRVDTVRFLHVMRFQEVSQWVPGPRS